MEGSEDELDPFRYGIRPLVRDPGCQSGLPSAQGLSHHPLGRLVVLRCLGQKKSVAAQGVLSPTGHQRA